MYPWMYPPMMMPQQSNKKSSSGMSWKTYKKMEKFFLKELNKEEEKKKKKMHHPVRMGIGDTLAILMITGPFIGPLYLYILATCINTMQSMLTNLGHVNP